MALTCRVEEPSTASKADIARLIRSPVAEYCRKLIIGRADTRTRFNAAREPEYKLALLAGT